MDGADLAGQLLGPFELARGEGRGDGRHPDGLTAELAGRNREHEGAVDAAGVADERRTKHSDARRQPLELPVDFAHRSTL